MQASKYKPKLVLGARRVDRLEELKKRCLANGAADVRFRSLRLSTVVSPVSWLPRVPSLVFLVLRLVPRVPSLVSCLVSHVSCLAS